MRPFTTCTFIGFIVPLGTAIFAFFLAGLIWNKYLKKKTVMLKYLSLALTFLALAVFVDPFIVMFTQNNDVVPAFSVLGNWSLASTLPFAMSAIANVFILLFVKQVFFKDKNAAWIYPIVIAEIAVGFLTVLFGILGEDTLIVLLLHVVLTITTYFILFANANRIASRVDKNTDPVGYHGMRIIALSALFLVFTIVAFILHEVSYAIPELNVALTSVSFFEGGCSYFVPMGWFLAIVSALFLYLGYGMPDWFKRRWEE